MRKYAERICGLVLALVTVLLSLALVSPSASADGAARATYSQMVEKTVARTLYSADGNMAYRMYKSPSYTATDDTKPALIILYFHDSGKSGSDNLAQLSENSVLSLLLSEDCDNKYKDFNYIVLAPQCLSGDSWVKSKGSDHSYDPEGETVSMKLAHAIVGEMGATEIVFTDRLVVIGEGDGATAAFDYVCRYPDTVSRFLTVGGMCDGYQLTSVFDVFNITGLAFVPGGDSVVADNYNKTVKLLKDRSRDDMMLVDYVDGDLSAAIGAAAAYNEPTVPEWAIAEQYGSIRFLIKSSHNGTGGSITASTYAPYGGNATFKITLKRGNYIEYLRIDGVNTDLSRLKKADEDGLVYTYTFENVREQGHTIAVSFVATASPENVFDSAISAVIKWCTVLAGLLIVLAVTVYLTDRFMSGKDGKEGKGARAV